MQVVSSSFTVAEFCEQLRNGGISVNHDYQRTDKVWPPAARSYLIETLLMGYPIPKMALHQITDLKTKRTRKEIVDGQQRSQAILDFVDDRFRLSAKSSYGNKNFSQLDPEDQQKLIDYGLTVDLFVGATSEDIRQVFRRMNSYTVPLNPPEKRHATHQGEFKWFIVEMSERYAESLKTLGVLKEKQISRMADSALLSDITYTLFQGMKSASDTQLNRYYSDNDSSFPRRLEAATRIADAFNLIFVAQGLHQSSLMKSYNFYSLVLAISHALSPCAALMADYPRVAPAQIDLNIAIPNLTALSAALDDPASAPNFASFVAAGSKATNRIEPRRVRFAWLSRALEPTLLF